MALSTLVQRAIAKNFGIYLIFIINFIVYDIESWARPHPKEFPAANQQNISVLIGKDLAEFWISGLDIKREILTINNHRQHSGTKKIKFYCNYRQKESTSNELLAKVASPTGILEWDKVKYRGNLLVFKARRSSRCTLINQLQLEDYLSSLLAKEMNAKWPLEALKAQAIAGRTYALYKMQQRKKAQKWGKGSFYDIESSELHQVSGSLFDETSQTALAVKLTAGQVLTSMNGEIQPIFFHAKCGGRTLRPEHVWDGPVEGYQMVSCPFCHELGPKEWKSTLDTAKVYRLVLKEKGQGIEAMGQNLRATSQIQLLPDQREHLSLRFYQGEKLWVINKPQLRRVFGRKIIPSNHFQLTMQSGGQFVVQGVGNGHGVGMCQLGALELAQKGWDYQKILKYYFPQFVLNNVST